MTSRTWLFRRIGRHRAAGRQRDEVYDARKTRGVGIVMAEDVDTAYRYDRIEHRRSAISFVAYFKFVGYFKKESWKFF
jgi:hypothetical protein